MWVVTWSVAVQLAEVLRAGLLDVHKQRLASAGRPTPLTTVAIMDAEGHPLGPGERFSVQLTNSAGPGARRGPAIRPADFKAPVEGRYRFRIFAAAHRSEKPVVHGVYLGPDSFQKTSKLFDHFEAAPGSFVPREFESYMCVPLQARGRVLGALTLVSSGSGRHFGEADLALGFLPGLDAGFYQQTLFLQDFVCLASATHPRIGNGLTLRRFREEAHIALTLSGTGHDVVDDAIEKLRIPRRVLLGLPGFLALGAIVSTTDLVATALGATRIVDHRTTELRAALRELLPGGADVVTLRRRPTGPDHEE